MFQELKEQINVLTGARDQLMDKIQTLKQNQSEASRGNEETLLMLNEKNQGLQESINALTMDKENLLKEIAARDDKMKVVFT